MISVDAKKTVVANKELLELYIQIWWEYYPLEQSPKEIAQSVSEEFTVECTEDDVINTMTVLIEEADIKQQARNLNLYL